MQASLICPYLPAKQSLILDAHFHLLHSFICYGAGFGELYSAVYLAPIHLGIKS